MEKSRLVFSKSGNKISDIEKVNHTCRYILCL